MNKTTLILGIGNPIRADDGVGPAIADMIDSSKDKPKSISAINTGPVPENFTSVIKKQNPDHLILIDAAEMNIPPGKFRIIPKASLEELSLTTHSMPLSIFIDYLQSQLPKTKITLIGIQPKEIKDSEDLSQELKDATSEIAKILMTNKEIDNVITKL